MKHKATVSKSGGVVQVRVENDRTEAKTLVFTLTHEGLIVDAEDAEGGVRKTMSIMYDDLEEEMLK